MKAHTASLLNLLLLSPIAVVTSKDLNRYPDSSLRQLKRGDVERAEPGMPMKLHTDSAASQLVRDNYLHGHTTHSRVISSVAPDEATTTNRQLLDEGNSRYVPPVIPVDTPDDALADVLIKSALQRHFNDLPHLRSQRKQRASNAEVEKKAQSPAIANVEETHASSSEVKEVDKMAATMDNKWFGSSE